MSESHGSEPDLKRFVEAQNAGGTYHQALAELRAGRKQSHWMWFVFPQIAGLGSSPTARRFAISSVEEAHAYLAHPVLGSRLIEATRALLGHSDRTAETILGGIDAMKLRSSLTLFMLANPDEPVFEQALEAFFDAEPDQLTIDLVKRSG